MIDHIEKTDEVASLIRAALKEDGAEHDVTTLSLVDPSAKVTASIFARRPYRIAGCGVAAEVFRTVDRTLSITVDCPDGTDLAEGGSALTVRGAAGSVLSAERTALNFMQRMTGIATAARAFTEAVRGYDCVILDTRKTIPGFRLIDKYSVACGGAVNHRMGLNDMALIKDNHRQMWRTRDKSRLDLAVMTIRSKFPGIPVEVEVENFEELESALAGRPEWIMLDNMSLEDMRRAVEITAGRCKLEASGGIDLKKIRAVAETGVNAVSLGCLTHSVKAADLSLEITSI